ncbi:5-methyltetrahydropteroyltriglutamate--homocysteine S-methyltransferase [Silvanigrella aquatica]|uniref:5-methyltetrahydropteroyltriglutamate--homocysteine methyltransferase n=1 Tax=Silvanigrella aquatica TaxID=1915309 RepID=A0A1L4D3K8_9BACT|nr:5-methyltetrahydropteroyltriglutamate--homocysteine S-methyltransferase [Silvanigrella aquatica]APJ04769.1 5-methyltetrahydropteroyltriglutamate--homocysteine S-methyltransferase [Silvanigrella aquatica]
MINSCTHILGFPRIGKKRELKKALESYWKLEITQKQLLEVGKKICEENWKIQSESNLSFITVGDFSWYDHVLETSALLGVIPKRFLESDNKINIDTLFCMARGQSLNKKEHAACEMTKWFNTNYHYIVPEFSKNQNFQLTYNYFFEQIDHALSFNYKIKPVLLGPLTYLWLGKTKGDEFNKLNLIENLIPIYNEIFRKLKDNKIEWLQLDEPILALDLPNEWIKKFKFTYDNLNFHDIKILTTTYFGSISENINIINNLPVHGLHVDLCSAPQQIHSLIKNFDNQKTLSAGVVNGRNIWKSDYNKIIDQLNILKQSFSKNLWIGSSCSLIHSPVDLESEQKLDPEIKNWLSFAKQKTIEIKSIEIIFNKKNGYEKNLQQNKFDIQSRLISKKVINPSVKKRISDINPKFYHRDSNYEERSIKQKNLFHLPLFPTTTIGSFPQTQNIRELRKKLKEGSISNELYTQQIKEHIKECITIQENLELDVLVHGEAERNDMVEYFAEFMNGFIFTSQGWVQSYGSRCVKPPIIYGDVFRAKAITVEWAKYSQSLTNKPVKGMLTGPVTILSWSFVRDDQPTKETALQISLALRDEVLDLEKAGIKIIQIDEPAFREALPLQKKDWEEYLSWSVKCFKIASCGVEDSTQIHTHMCYSEFNDIIHAIANLDADVITLECSRSNMELLQAFENFSYPNEIGPGIYDIHSPLIPNTNFIVMQLEKALQFIPKERLWINPDCGLKTRNWPEVSKALKNMTEAAKNLRRQFYNNSNHF